MDKIKNKNTNHNRAEDRYNVRSGAKGGEPLCYKE